MLHFRIDDSPPGAERTNAVMEAIGGADIVIADVTDTNPNVMYELGHAHCLRKPTIILAESSSKDLIPYDLCGYGVVIYDRGDLASLQNPLVRFLREHAECIGR